MISDEERREVAARLRKAIGLTEFAEVLGFNWTDDSDWVWKDVSNLVADLIEPAQYHFVDSDEKCDRDALLALADELEEIACWEVQSTGDDNRAWMLKGVCDRIREALGVSDG